MVQGASATYPMESLQDLVSNWFVFDSADNVVPLPPYLEPEPELGVDGDFSNCLWESLHSQQSNPLVPYSVWKCGALATTVGVPFSGMTSS
jgi:hypothetical protein